MKIVEFEIFKKEFSQAVVDKKIRMYAETDGLTKEQYGALLRIFPINKIGELEAALK